MKTLIFLFLSFSTFAQEGEIVYKNLSQQHLTRYINESDTSYIFSFKDMEYSLLDVHEHLPIDLQDFVNQCNEVLKTGDRFICNKYQLSKQGQSVYILVGNTAHTWIGKNSIRKMWLKR
jgi:hypothetical protein